MLCNPSRRFTWALMFAVAASSPAYAGGNIHPASYPHYGCFGYCPGPITPQRQQYYGCFGYCNGPLNPTHHATCFGYCPSGGSAFIYPTVSVYQPPSFMPAPEYGGNIYYQAPQQTPPDSGSSYQGKTLDQWGKQLKSDSARERGAAVAALGHFGAQAKAYVTDLIALLKDKDAAIRVQAADTLARIGKDVVPILKDALKDDSPLVRMGAALALGHLGGAAKGVLPDLKEALKDKDLAVRCHVAQAIWRIDPKSSDVVIPVFTEGMNSDNMQIRQAALSMMSQMGADARKALPSLMDALKNDDPLQKVSIATTLYNVDPKESAGASVTALADALSSKNMEARINAARVLAHMGDKAKEAIPALAKALLDPEPQLNYEASVALSWQGAAGVEPLIKGLASETAMIRRHAALALGEIGPPAKAAVPDLIKALQDKDEMVKTFAGDALHKIDPAAAKKAGVP